jgi:hypothetical protein
MSSTEAAAYFRQTEETVDLGAVKCFAILLGLTGFLLLPGNIIAGVLALCLLCKVGCCCGGDDATMKSAIFNGGCCCCKTLIGLAISIAVLCGLSLPLSYFFLGHYVSNVCGAMVTDASSTVGHAALAAAEGVLVSAATAWEAAHIGAAEPRIESQTVGDFGLLLVYPPGVCDFAPGSIAGYSGIYYPHPLSSFSDRIRNYLLGTNAVGFVLACLVAYFAAQARKALRAQAMTMPMALAVDQRPMMVVSAAVP